MLKQLLQLGEITGVGRNRALGLGITKTKIEEIG